MFAIAKQIKEAFLVGLGVAQNEAYKRFPWRLSQKLIRVASKGQWSTMGGSGSKLGLHGATWLVFWSAFLHPDWSRPAGQIQQRMGSDSGWRSWDASEAGISRAPTIHLGPLCYCPKLLNWSQILKIHCRFQKLLYISFQFRVKIYLDVHFKGNKYLPDSLNVEASKNFYNFEFWV